LKVIAKASTTKPIAAFIESVGADGEVHSLKIVLPVGTDVDKVKEAIAVAIDPDWISIDWHVDDVHEVVEGLTEGQAREVLEFAKRNHDANIGINWYSLRAAHEALDFEPRELV
jgi:hypothetical protein